jgi:hypothetical protein
MQPSVLLGVGRISPDHLSYLKTSLYDAYGSAVRFDQPEVAQVLLELIVMLDTRYRLYDMLAPEAGEGT